MRSLSRYTLLLILFSICFATSFAQDKGAGSKQSAPPSPLREAADENDPNSWKEFSPAGGLFAVLFPGTPAESTEVSDTEAGKVTMHTFALDTGTAVYSIIYSDYPFNLEVPPEVSRLFLNGMREGATENSKQRLLEAKEITVEGHPGLYLKAQAGNGNLFQSKAILVGNRCYTATFVVNDEGAPDELVRFHREAAARFLNSFRLTTGQKADGEVDELLRKGDIYGLGSKDASHTGGRLIDGVLTSRALSLPKPEYPPIARAARVQGTVSVKVIVDETGKVIAAQAESGHPLLQAAAVKAARQARFEPILLEGKPVKIAGVINYHFTADAPPRSAP